VHKAVQTGGLVEGQRIKTLTVAPVQQVRSPLLYPLSYQSATLQTLAEVNLQSNNKNPHGVILV
jgi:hypothetical protein